MKKKIIIIGMNSFIGTNLYKNLKKKFIINRYGFKSFIEKDIHYIKNADYVINCSTNKDYVTKKYSSKNDFDYQISEKIKKLKCNMIFLSSRKVYKIGDNLKEYTKTAPSCNYSKNKLMTEKKLLKQLPNRVLILRISNLIGIKKYKENKKKIHKTFNDIFFENIKKKVVFDNRKNYKDFLSINKLAEIVGKLITKKAYGIYNVSLGRKVYLNKLVKWLNSFNLNNFKLVDMPKNYNSDCFFLNNDKLMKKINIKNRLIDLEKECKKISKLFFK